MIKALLLLFIPLAQVIFRPEASMQTFENQYAYYVDSTQCPVCGGPAGHAEAYRLRLRTWAVI